MVKTKPVQYLLITIGTVILSVGVYFFKFPNNFCTGGVSGLALILGTLLHRSTPASMILIINCALLVLGFLVFGRHFGVKTAYASLLFSGIVYLLEHAFPITAPLTDQPLLELVFAIMLPAIGSAILFNNDASSGGTDVVAMILQKYTKINIGRSLLVSDILIVGACFFAFGVKAGLFSLVGLAGKALVVDSVIENFNISKCFTIVTTKPKEICDIITDELHRGATVMDAEGAFTGDGKSVILTAVSRNQALYLQKRIREIDADSFIMISNTGEIIGRGFHGVEV